MEHYHVWHFEHLQHVYLKPFVPLLIIPSTNPLSTSSAASPPVLIKLAQKAWNGDYVDMAGLLPQVLSAVM